MAKKRNYVKKYIKAQKSAAGEPEIKDFTNAELTRVLNWYNISDIPEKTRKTWVLDFAKDNGYDVKVLKAVPEKWFVGTITAVCRLTSRGFSNENSVKFIEKNMPKLMGRAPEAVLKPKVDDVKKPTIQDRIMDKAKIYIAEVDYFVDCKLKDDTEGDIKALLSKDNSGAPQAKHVLAHVEKYIKEFTDVKASKKTDKELFDAYGMSVRKLNSLVKYLEALKADCEKYLKIKKASRKVSTRKKKVKSPTELCKAVTVSEKSLCKATKVVGASVAVTYNEKWERITLLFAEDSGGLSVKGKTIVNVDMDKSKVLKVKKAHAKKFMKEINSKTGIRALKTLMKDDDKFRQVGWAKVSGRLSEQTNILQAV